MRAAVQRFLRDDRGATAIEYGLITALIVLAILGGMGAYAQATANKYQQIQSKLDSPLS